MKRLVIIPLVLLMVVMTSGALMAQSLGTANTGAGRPALAPCVLGPDDVTQNVDCTIVPITGIACSSGGIDAGNQYLRRFLLGADHGILSTYTVDAVQFGLEVADAGGGACAGVPLTFNTYSIATGDSILYSNMTLLASTSIDATGAGGTIVTAAVGGSVDPSTDDLVVEVVTCDSSNTGDFGSIFPGANGAGQTGPTYIASDACSIFDPIDLGDLGFPDSHNVFVVEGTEEGDPCQGSFRQPRMRRRSGGVSIDFRFDITHARDTVTVPIYIELEDMAGNVVASRDLGSFTLSDGVPMSVREILTAPASTAPGSYLLVARIPRMKRVITFKKLITLP